MTFRAGRASRTLLAVTLAVGMAACSTSERPGPDGASDGATGPAGGTGSSYKGQQDPALAPFYGQKLTWKNCDGNECADLTVPVDYAKPSGKTIAIKVLRVKAKGDRRGALVVNPGGPGGSGVDYAKAADAIVGAPVREHYDVVGFDPRGVGGSATFTCVDDKTLDEYLGLDPSPTTKDQIDRTMSLSKTLVDGCAKRNPDLIKHMSTVDAAKDMDVLRGALGERRLNYLGKSYGTFLGATYADLFPKLVGRMVLDGVMPPDLTADEMNLGQAKGFEMATRAYMQDCVDNGNCPFGTNVDEGMKQLRTFLSDLEKNPIPTRDSAVPTMGEGWASLGVGVALYDDSQWSTLTDAIRAAKGGDGSQLMSLANTYAERKPGGGYDNNIMQVIFAVNCTDRPDSPDPQSYVRNADRFSKEAPTWGAFLAWGNAPCGVWPVKPNDPQIKPHKVSAPGSAPIVVVGTTRDPATPYEWAVRLRHELSNASLVTFKGDGHTAYGRSNSCVDDAVNSYLVEGTTPKDGLQC